MKLINVKSNSPVKPISVFLRGALIPRLFGAIIGFLVLVLFFTSHKKINYDSAYLMVAFSTVVSLYLGSRVDFLRMKVRPPKWSVGYFSSLVVFLLGLYLLSPELVSISLLPFGFFINISYIGAKFACVYTGCCGIRSIKDKHFGGWPFRPRLQTFEVFASFVVLFLGLSIMCFGLEVMAGIFLVVGHGILRWFAAKYRFPYRSYKYILLSPSCYIILITPVLVALFNFALL